MLSAADPPTKERKYTSVANTRCPIPGGVQGQSGWGLGQSLEQFWFCLTEEWRCQREGAPPSPMKTSSQTGAEASVPPLILRLKCEFFSSDTSKRSPRLNLEKLVCSMAAAQKPSVSHPQCCLKDAHKHTEWKGDDAIKSTKKSHQK